MIDPSKMAPQEAMQYMTQVIQESGIDPSIFVQLGQFAEQVVADNSLYPQFAKTMVEAGLLDQSQVSAGVQYQTLATLSALGRVANQLIQSGGVMA